MSGDLTDIILEEEGRPFDVPQEDETFTTVHVWNEEQIGTRRTSFVQCRLVRCSMLTYRG